MPKISELPLANKLKEEDYIPIVQDGVTKKVKGTHFVTEEEYSLDAFSPTIAANDKTMYKFGEGDTVDFSDSAYDGAYKSAILKGNTLVNLLKSSHNVTVTANGSWITTHTNMINDSMIKLSTTYTLITYVHSNTIEDGDGYIFGVGGGNQSNFLFTGNQVVLPRQTGMFKKLLTTRNDTSLNYTLQQVMYNTCTQGAITFSQVLLEGDYTNVDIPYFTGMQSVKMPVLMMTGKNLFDVNGGIIGDSTTLIQNNTITTKPKDSNVVFTIDNKNSMTFSYSITRRDNVVYVGAVLFKVLHDDGTETNIHEKVGTTTVTFSKPVKSIKLVNWCNGEFVIENIQLEQGTVATPYELYKSNILTTLEPIELGKVGDVEDTLNLLTGEVVESTYEYTFNGTESNITLHSDKTNKMTFRLPLNIDVKPNNINGVICNKMKTINLHSLLTDDTAIGVCTHNTDVTKNVYIAILKSDLETQDVNGCKKWLKINTPTVRVVANKKVVKTVDLSGTPFGYKGGHIIKSSAEGSLLPKFEYEVAVSRGAQISQNTSTLIKHDEKITELLKKTAATYINQKAEIAYLLNMSSTLEEAQTIPFIEDDYINDDCMVDSDMVMDDMQVEPEKEIIDNVDTLLINLIYDLIELNDTLGLSEKVELFRQSGLIDKHNYEIIKEKLNPSFKEEDYADINQ